MALPCTSSIDYDKVERGIVLLSTVESGGLSRLGLVEFDHGQFEAPHDVRSTSCSEVLEFPRRTVAEMTEPVILAGSVKHTELAQRYYSLAF